MWIGIGLGLIFWILESALHVLVFEQTGFFHQLYRPEPHELWMHLTIVGMFIVYGIYGQMIVNSRRKAEKTANLANTELTQIFETAADAMRLVDREFNVLRVNETFLALSGMPRDRILGKNVLKSFTAPSVEHPAAQWNGL